MLEACLSRPMGDNGGSAVPLQVHKTCDFKWLKKIAIFLLAQVADGRENNYLFCCRSYSIRFVIVEGQFCNV